MGFHPGRYRVAFWVAEEIQIARSAIGYRFARCYTFELVDLPGYAFAETVEDGAYSAHEAEYPPEQRTAEYMRDIRLRMWQQQDSPGNQISAGDDTGMAENQRGNSSPTQG
jgi:hypothetical protein